MAKDKQFLINPFGLHYSEVTASNLVKIDLQGEVLDGSNPPGEPGGFCVARHHPRRHTEGAHCVMHTHTTAGVAVASLQGGLQQTNFYSAQLHDMVAYHDFEGITIHAEEGPRVMASIDNKPAVILRNHGLLSWGATVPHAFAVLWTLQRACEIQVATLAMGAPHRRRPRPSPRNARGTRCSSILGTALAVMCSMRWCGRSTASTPATRFESTMSETNSERWPLWVRAPLVAGWACTWRRPGAR